jgi:hypothetical protein
MIVKTVLNGDTIVVRGAEIGSRKVVDLHGITAPTKDEPFYFESRDALRKLLVGKNVQLDDVHQDGNECHLHLDGQDVSSYMVINGWAHCSTIELKELETIAKSKKLGIHSDQQDIVQNLEKFLDDKEISGILSFVKVGVIDILQDYFTSTSKGYWDLRGLDKVVDMIILEFQLSFAQNIKDKVLYNSSEARVRLSEAIMFFFSFFFFSFSLSLFFLFSFFFFFLFLFLSFSFFSFSFFMWFVFFLIFFLFFSFLFFFLFSFLSFSIFFF